ncbi:MAG: TetR/AcrR family transcriptional regulator [Anaerovoracaceae bacterium]|nr:TetR/AcrR family transcriptional regulator [Anaerovoracaceae bacterium]
MKSKKTRERILDASLELFNQKKASNVSTVQISAAMKISPGNLYYYYANKEDVIRCIWEERMSSVLKELLKKTEQIKSSADVLDFIRESLEYMIEYRFFFTEISTLFINDDKLIEIYREADQEIRDTFNDAIDRDFKAGKLVKHDEVTRTLVVQNAIAAAKQMLDNYDVYMANGVSAEDFIGYCWIRIIAVLETIFSDDMKEEMNKELEARGFNKERYLELSR